jgi:nucleotide-binding universal stress UspA family protein
MEGFTPRRILVPINGAPTDDEAVRLACRMARRGKGRVNVITVLEVERSLPLGAIQEAETEAAEALLEHAEGVAAELDSDVETDVIQAREAGPAIVDEVRQWRADLVIVGLPFRVRYGEFYLGETAPFVLRHATCRALVFREPAEE